MRVLSADVFQLVFDSRANKDDDNPRNKVSGFRAAKDKSGGVSEKLKNIEHFIVALLNSFDAITMPAYGRIMRAGIQYQRFSKQPRPASQTNTSIFPRFVYHIESCTPNGAFA